MAVAWAYPWTAVMATGISDFGAVARVRVAVVVPRGDDAGGGEQGELGTLIQRGFGDRRFAVTLA